MSISKELFKLANELSEFDQLEAPELDLLIEVSNNIGNSWSGSWFGYHSRVYYEDFQTPPSGAAFSQEWGLEEAFSMGSRGHWREYQFDAVIALIHKKAGNAKIDKYLMEGSKALEKLDSVKSSVLSIVHASFS